MAEATRCAVVTGANKGIGLEICRQLAASGVRVVLTARDEKRGVEALESLKASGLSNVVFHQLDVVDPASIASLSDFIKSQYGKLDIMVNNAGMSASIVQDPVAFRSAINAAYATKRAPPSLRPTERRSSQMGWYNESASTEGQRRHERKLLRAEQDNSNFHSSSQLSNSPRIVNVSCTLGKLEFVKEEWAKAVLSDVENLTEEKVDEVLRQFIKDYKEGPIEAKSWSEYYRAYAISKAALNACTRIVAVKYPALCINSVCPGFVKTDINYNTGILSVEEGAAGPVMLALLPQGGPSGQFFSQKELSNF